MAKGGFNFKEHSIKRKKYLHSIYSKKEIAEIRTMINYSNKELDHVIRSYLKLDESFRLLKKHYNISEKDMKKIIKKHRVPPLHELFQSKETQNKKK